MGKVVDDPVTLYKHDLTTRIEEWHQISGESESGDLYLIEKYGVWDENNKQAPVKVQIQKVLYPSPNELSAAIDERIKKLDSEGWKYKFTRFLDMRTNALREERI